MRTQITVVLLSYMLMACTSSPQPAVPTQQPISDDELSRAVARAHDSLQVFVQNLQSPKPSQSLFALKVHFDYPDTTSEDVWVDDVHFENGKFYGVLYDVQSKTMGFKNGDRVKLPEDIILDWMFLENNVLVGGYTIRLAYEHMTPQQQKTFLKDAQYSLQ
jgi:uncharacterized protein YegJ (DUF2314 family)